MISFFSSFLCFMVKKLVVKCFVTHVKPVSMSIVAFHLGSVVSTAGDDGIARIFRLGK